MKSLKAVIIPAISLHRIRF